MIYTYANLTNLIAMSISECQAYANASEQYQKRVKAISKGKSNSKKKRNSNTVKNVFKIKIITKIKEKQTDKIRSQLAIYKSKGLNGYYSPVENNNIENDEEYIMNKMWEEIYAMEAIDAVEEKLYYASFGHDDLKYYDFMDYYPKLKYYKTD